MPKSDDQPPSNLFENIRKLLNEHGYETVDDFLHYKHKEFRSNDKNDPTEATPAVFYNKLLNFFAEQDAKKTEKVEKPSPICKR